MNQQTLDRFWAKVRKTESCWLWTAALNEAGYGIFGTGDKKIDRAHRIVYRLTRGQIPKGMFVCHSCDIPACVNPAHLFLGTNQDNVNDMLAKGRNSPPPNMGGWNKIDVSNDPAMHLLGFMPDTYIAQKLGVSKHVIQRERRRRGIPALPSQTLFKSGQPHPRWSRNGG